MVGFMNAEILSIGNELVLGQTVDTNSGWLAAKLTGDGIQVTRHVTVGDDVAVIRDAIVQAAATADVVVLTGGLGPTADDVTRQALAGAMETTLEVDASARAALVAFFERLHRPMPVTNERQALRPQGATIIENTCGTAPGLRAEMGRAIVYALPGVPEEMRTMYRQFVEPELRGRGGGVVVRTRTVNCFGASEADAGRQIEDLMTSASGPLVGITAKDAILRIRIVVRAQDTASADAVLDETAAEVRRRLGSVVFGQDDDTLQAAVGKLLIRQGSTLATAESCTGGMLGQRLTDVPGSSAYYAGGFVTYANEAKTAELGVLKSVIDRHGAVSGEVAAAMANGCRERMSVDLAVSVTGIAGPGGGTDDKPVGLVYVGLADDGGCEVRELRLGDYLDRRSIRDRACSVALNMLRLRLTAMGVAS